MAPTWPIPSFDVAPPPTPSMNPIVLVSDDEDDDNNNIQAAADIVVLSDDEDDGIQAATSSRHQSPAPPPPPSLVLPASSSPAAASSTITVDFDFDDIEEEVQEVQPAAARRRMMLRPPCYNHWSFSEEVNILKALARMRRKYGSADPVWKPFHDSLRRRGLLIRDDATYLDLTKKVNNLKRRFEEDAKRGRPRGPGRRDRWLYELSLDVWDPPQRS